MSSALDIIDRLPWEHQARLEADDYFVDIPVVVAEEGNIRLEITRKQAVITNKGGHRGVAVIVLQIVADDEQPNIQFGPMTLKPSFQVVENLELNRDVNGTRKSARKVARRIRDVIKGGAFVGLVTDMKPDKPCIEPVHLGEELGALVKAYQVNFRCLETPSVSPSQVATPVFGSIQGATPQFTIACATAGATIYYTTDCSYPSAQNPNAHAYASPVNLPTDPSQSLSVTVRACAYVPGMIASSINQSVIQSVIV